MPNIVAHALLCFPAVDGGEDPTAFARQLHLALDETGETGAVFDRAIAQRRITALVATLKERFGGGKNVDLHDFTDSDPDDLDVNVWVDDPSVEYDVAADYVDITLYSEKKTEPSLSAAALEDFTADVLAAGYDTIFDPQLDRLVTLPHDTDAIAAAWLAAYRAENGDARRSAYAHSNADAARALGRGEPKPGLFSRLFGR